MNRLSWLAAAAAATLLAHAPAHAAASSSASLSNLTFTLYDLNTTDGITPWIWFAGNGLNSAFALNSAPAESDSHWSFGSGHFDGSTVSAGTSMSTASGISTGGTPATISGEGSITVGNLQASGNAKGTTGTLGSEYSRYSAYGQWAQMDGYNFAISANTLLEVSADAEVLTKVTHGYTNSPYDREYAGGFVELSISGPMADGYHSVDGLAYDTYNTLGPRADSQLGKLFISVVNDTESSQDGFFVARVSAYGYSYAAAVPEPETYAMMLAGLSAIGFMARRSKQG